MMLRRCCRPCPAAAAPRPPGLESCRSQCRRGSALAAKAHTALVLARCPADCLCDGCTPMTGALASATPACCPRSSRHARSGRGAVALVVGAGKHLKHPKPSPPHPPWLICLRCWLAAVPISVAVPHAPPPHPDHTHQHQNTNRPTSAWWRSQRVWR